MVLVKSVEDKRIVIGKVGPINVLNSSPDLKHQLLAVA